MFFTFLFVLAVAVFLFSQWIYPLWANKPLFPLFRKRKKKVVLEIKQEETEMTAEKALDLVNFHCERILHFIAVAESYAENEEETAKDKLNRTRYNRDS